MMDEMQNEIDAMHDKLKEQKKEFDEQQNKLEEQRSELTQQQSKLDQQQYTIDQQQYTIDQMKERYDESLLNAIALLRSLEIRILKSLSGSVNNIRWMNHSFNSIFSSVPSQLSDIFSNNLYLRNRRKAAAPQSLFTPVLFFW